MTKPRPKRPSSRTRKPTRYTATEEAESIELGQARWMFLLTLNHLVPDLFVKLRDDVWPVYKKVFRSAARRSSKRSAAGREAQRLGPCDRHIAQTLVADSFLKWYQRSAKGGDPCTTELRKALQAWATEFNVNCPWVVEAALITLRAWEGNSDLADPPRAFMRFPGYRSLPIEEMHFDFFVPMAWDPTTQTRSVARRSIRDTFTKRLDAYLDRMEALAREHGFVRMETRRRGSLEQHANWLVRYQVQRQSASRIAGRSDHSTVLRPIRRLARLIDLPLRPPLPAGRKPGSKLPKRPHA